MQTHIHTHANLQHWRIEVANEVIWKTSCCMRQQEALFQDDLMMCAGNTCQGQSNMESVLGDSEFCSAKKK